MIKLTEDHKNKILAMIDAIDFAEEPDSTVVMLARREGTDYRLVDLAPIEEREVASTSGMGVLLRPTMHDMRAPTIVDKKERDPEVSDATVPRDLFAVARQHKPTERAVVAMGQKNGVIMSYSGRAFDFEMSEIGSTTEDLGMPEPPEGISIFEGHLHTWGPSMDGDYDAEWRGTYREPTVSEWNSIRRGECPWPDEREPPTDKQVERTRQAQVDDDFEAVLKMARRQEIDEATITKLEPLFRYLVEMAHCAYAQGRGEFDPKLDVDWPQVERCAHAVVIQLAIATSQELIPPELIDAIHSLRDAMPRDAFDAQEAKS